MSDTRRILGSAVLAILLLIAILPAQTSRAAQTGDAKLLRYAKDACGARWVIRRQAAKRLVKAGKAGFSAVEKHIAQEGRTVLSSELVDALGDFDNDEARSLLISLVGDTEFYWRPQALQAMAKKPRVSEALLFRSFCQADSYLLRRAALNGLDGIATKSRPPELGAALEDKDLRIRVHAAGLLLEREDQRGLPILIGALLVEDSFFAVDYGSQLRRTAIQWLKSWAGSDLGYRANAPAQERRKAVLTFHEKASHAIGKFDLPTPAKTEGTAWILGFERRSCKKGDLVLRLDKKGRVWRGLFHPRLLQTSEETTAKLTELASQAPSKGRRVHGKIRCDYTRLAGLGDKASFSLRAAPGAMPAAADALVKLWLELARAAEK